MIEIQNLSLRNGSFALDGISLAVPAHRFAVLMGATGCGKTTLLEAICGLKTVASGAIHLAGRDVTRLRPAERGVGYVPQDAALFATMSVAENLGFALRVRRWPATEIRQRVDSLAQELGIAHLLDRRPLGLSGGEAQRVALGRALAARPAVLCLDEPLNALDADTRQEMVDLLKRVQASTGVTALHVTHDRAEAKQLGDVLFQFSEGKVTAAKPD
ncbi:MAG: ABC transporter ATP-binding protein [Planctomycetota bacterium]|nr:ABC transporter ATP-binding protein [Planctomycetota bacterium]